MKINKSMNQLYETDQQNLNKEIYKNQLLNYKYERLNNRKERLINNEIKQNDEYINQNK